MAVPLSVCHPQPGRRYFPRLETTFRPAAAIVAPARENNMELHLTMTKQLVLGVLALVVATPAMAQNEVVSKAMFAQASGKYVAPKCSADKNKHFKVGSGNTYLRSAIETTPDKQEGLLNQAHNVVVEAIKDEGQGNQPSAWYSLGRIDLFRGDVVGADSALRKAEALAPDCKTEIEQLRRIAYAPVANDASQKLQAGDAAGAMAAFRLASAINPSSGFAPYNIAAIYAQEGNNDSSIAYFRKAAAIQTTDSNEAKIAKRAQYNLGVMQLNSGKPQGAVATFEKYTAENPGDADAKVALAKAYRAAGMNEKAKALDAQTGTTTAAAPTASGELDSALALYKQKKYAEAMPILQKILATDPNNTAALSALAVSQLATKDPGLAATASKLSELEPLNRYAIEMTREGYRATKDGAKAQASAEKLLGLGTGIVITGLTLGANSADLTGTATGYEAANAKTGKAIPPAPVTVTFEFLDKSGGVVASKDVTIPALAKDATENFSVNVTGEGITGYRYKVKA